MAEMTAYFTVKSKLRELLSKHKAAKFLVTGHSLGGALAILFPAVLVLHEEEDIMQRLLGVHTFGLPHSVEICNQLFSKSEFVIDSPQKLKRKLEMVEALGEIVVATKLLEEDMGMQEDPLYSSYERLNCELLPLEVHSKEFSMVSKYMKNTHAKTHSNYTVEIVQILRVSREGEAERFKKFSGMKNKMLLWHGSRLTNWTGILKQGLRIAPWVTLGLRIAPPVGEFYKAWENECH